jgi:hypothetical protein
LGRLSQCDSQGAAKFADVPLSGSLKSAFRAASLIGVVFAIAGCSSENTKSAVGTCRQMLMERLHYDFEGNVTPRDAEYVSACMTARGFSVDANANCNVIQMTYAGRCYRRRSWF